MSELKGQVGSFTTQVATTAGSYAKAANRVKMELDMNMEPASVLDYGAGLGLGTDKLVEAFGVSVESYEPFPERWKGDNKVTYTNAGAIHKEYDVIINMNVLNVLEPELRKSVATDILSKLKTGGVAIISTRAWKGDIANVKNYEVADEHNAIWVNKNHGLVYQKGFDGDELIDYLRELGGDDFDFEKVSGIGSSCVMVKRIIEKTQEQRLHDWMKNSVLEKDGVPMVLYHGSDSANQDNPDFKFQVGVDSKRYTTFSEKDVKSTGVFLSESYEDAASYGNNVHGYYAKITRPLTNPRKMKISSRSGIDEVLAYSKLVNDVVHIFEPVIDKMGEDIEDGWSIDINGGIGRVDVSNMEDLIDAIFHDDEIEWHHLDNLEVAQRMTELNYDGVKVTEPDDGVGYSWFVPDPEQLKSITEFGQELDHVLNDEVMTV